MKMNFKDKLGLAAMCLLCVILLWKYAFGLEGTEFSGGRLTGPLLDMEDIGAFLFIPALLLTFWYPRVAAAIAIVASFLCLPLYLYFTAPGPFRWICRGQYSVAAPANFVWIRSAIAGITALALAAYVGIRTLLIQSPTGGAT